MALGNEIGELIETAEDEIDELHFGDRAKAEIAHAAGGADDGAFADGRVDDAFPAKLLEETFAGFERASVDADVFADKNHARVGGHFFKHRLADGFEESDGSHGHRPPFFANLAGADFLAADFFIGGGADLAGALGGAVSTDDFGGGGTAGFSVLAAKGTSPK